MKRPDINKLKTLCENATSSPWGILDCIPYVLGGDNLNTHVVEFAESENMIGNAEFIAESRQAVPELIEYIEQLEKDIDLYRYDAIESTNKTKLVNIKLDLITDKVKELIERNKILAQALTSIHNATLPSAVITKSKLVQIHDTAKGALNND